MSEPQTQTTDQITPGPWEAYRDDRREKYEIGKREHSFVTRVVAHVSFGFDEPAETEQHANARLIAAAPDLLALARQYARECANCNGRGFTVGDDGVSGRGPDDVEPTRYPCEDCEDIRAIIAKAEGRS